MIFDRLRSKAQTRHEQTRAVAAAEDVLKDFVATRRGVEAWAEEATGFNKASILLVAGDGEWLRRVVPDTAWARDFAARLHLVCYTAGVDRYPERMRAWDEAHRRAGQWPTR